MFIYHDVHYSFKIVSVTKLISMVAKKYRRWPKNLNKQIWINPNIMCYYIVDCEHDHIVNGMYESKFNLIA